VYASSVSNIGLSSLFYALGVTEGSSSLQQLGATFASPTMGFIIGTVIVLLITILCAVGTKRVVNLQNVLVSVGILGILVVLGVPLSYNKATFASAVSKYVSYNAVISAGGAAPSQFALDQTVLATGLVALTMLFGQFSVYVGGEIRTPEKSIPKAIVITTLVTTVALLIGGYIVHSVFGIEFTASLYSLWNTPAYPFQTGGYQVGPYFNLLVSLLTNNPILIILIGLSFTFWTMSSAIFNLIANSRCVLSWSFDRVFPAKMATVNERFHTPVYAILLNAIIAEGLLYLFSFNVSVVSFMAGTTLGYVFTFGSAAIAGITFPLLKRSKSIYEGSPFRREFLGIPVISLFGFGTLVYLAILSYGLLTNAIFGVNSPLSLLGIAAFWILGGIIGAMFYAYRKRQGLEISKVFAMIPPE
jgi:amino acid transporter